MYNCEYCNKNINVHYATYHKEYYYLHAHKKGLKTVIYFCLDCGDRVGLKLLYDKMYDNTISSKNDGFCTLCNMYLNSYPSNKFLFRLQRYYKTKQTNLHMCYICKECFMKHTGKHFYKKYFGDKIKELKKEGIL
jgi:hypothetical protein